MRLLRLLGSGLLAAQVLLDISGINGLSRDALEGLPALTNGGGSVLMRGVGVEASGVLLNGTLNEGALREASTEEGSVDDEENPAALAEGESRADEAEPEEQFEAGNDGHAGVVVFLDELADGVGERRLRGGGLRRRRRAGRRGTGSRLNGGNDVGASVGRNVEDRVDGEREKGERDLAGVQPDQSHGCDIVSDPKLPYLRTSHAYRDIGHSRHRGAREARPCHRYAREHGNPCTRRYRRSLPPR